MLRTIFAASMLYGALLYGAHAACSSDDAMNKGSEISDVLLSKVQGNPDGTAKMMTELGDIMGTGSVTDQTCTKLNDLASRAKKL